VTHTLVPPDRLRALAVRIGEGAALALPRRDFMLWAPVLLGFGIALYFSLPLEPPVWLGWLMGGCALASLVAVRWRWGVAVILLAALPAFGFAVAQWRAHAVAAPVLTQPVTALVEGRVAGLSQSASGLPRLLLDRVTVYGLDPSVTPHTIRVTLRRAAEAAKAPMGTSISVMAALQPPGGPLAPGAFDFRRAAWFQRLGAIGVSRGALAVLAPPPEGILALPVSRLRAAVSTALRAAIDGQAGAFAAAIVTGDRSGLPADALEALRISGLAHLLAISGLHMAIAGGLVFAAVRQGLVLLPGAAERGRPKRIAAMVALGAALAYLVLSGGSVATQRAFVMAAVALGGVLADRPAVGLRGLCLAACLVLLAAPESLLAVGFQMSFAATLALVAVYAAVREAGWLQPSRRLRRRMVRYAVALVVTSVVAGLATAPFAAWHFNRLAPYGLFANLAAVPIMGLWVAPSLAIGGVLSLVGLGQPFFTLAGIGIAAILAVAEAFAALPGAVRPVPAAPGAILALIALGGLWLCLLRGSIRLAGLGVLVLAILLWPVRGDQREVMLIAPEVRLVAVRGPEGLVPEHESRGAYLVERWLRRDGDAASQAEAALRPGWRRDGVWLLAEPVAGLPIALTRSSRLYRRESEVFCQPGSVLIVPRARLSDPTPCLLLDADALDGRGTIALRAGTDGLTVIDAETTGRLWSPPRQ
jgi:competence protein ComEC